MNHELGGILVDSGQALNYRPVIIPLCQKDLMGCCMKLAQQTSSQVKAFGLENNERVD